MEKSAKVAVTVGLVVGHGGVVAAWMGAPFLDLDPTAGLEVSVGQWAATAARQYQYGVVIVVVVVARRQAGRQAARP